jgi:hypothetical protein
MPLKLLGISIKCMHSALCCIGPCYLNLSIILVHSAKTAQIFPQFTLSVYKGPLTERWGFNAIWLRPTAFSCSVFLSLSIDFAIIFTTFYILTEIFSNGIQVPKGLLTSLQRHSEAG